MAERRLAFRMSVIFCQSARLYLFSCRRYEWVLRLINHELDIKRWLPTVKHVMTLYGSKCYVEWCPFSASGVPGEHQVCWIRINIAGGHPSNILMWKNDKEWVLFYGIYGWLRHCENHTGLNAPKLKKKNFLGQVSHENQIYRAWLGEIMTTNSKNYSENIFKYWSSKIAAWNIARNLSRYK